MSETIRKPAVLVTGANGEMGHGLIHALAERGTFSVIALDVRPLDESLKQKCSDVITGDILETRLLGAGRRVRGRPSRCQDGQGSPEQRDPAG